MSLLQGNLCTQRRWRRERPRGEGMVRVSRALEQEEAQEAGAGRSGTQGLDF